MVVFLGANLGPPAPARAQAAGWHNLTGQLPPDVYVSQPQFTSDSRYVVFVANLEVRDAYDLYSVPITGSLPIKLNPPLVAGGTIMDFRIAPDGSRVVYTADQAVDERVELYSVPIGGGPATPLNGALPTGGNVNEFEIDGDSGRVIYVADAQTNDVFELYSVPITSGGNTKLNGVLAAGGDVLQFELDPTGDRVVYTADQDVNDLRELYSVPIAGGSALKLNPPLAVGIDHFAVAPGVAYVMFTAKEAGASAYELFGSDTTASTPRKRNYTLNPGEHVISFGLSPTGMQMVYTVGTNPQGGYGTLWRASPFSGPSQQLSDTAAAGAYGVLADDFRFTPSGERVVYRFFAPGQPHVLQSVRIIGGPLNRADLWTSSPGSLAELSQVSPDSQWVVFETSSTLDDHTVWSVPTVGGSAVNLGLGQYPQVTPDSRRVIYRSPPFVEHGDIFSVQIFGGGRRNLSQVYPQEGAYAPRVSPDGLWVLFQVGRFGPQGLLSTQWRASDGTEAPLVYNTYLPALQR